MLACGCPSAEQMLSEVDVTGTHHDVIISGNCGSPFVSLIVSVPLCSLVLEDEGHGTHESTYLNTFNVS